MKKLVSLMVVLMLTLGVVGTVGVAEEPLTIRYFGYGTAPVEGSDVQKYLEERYNIKLVIGTSSGADPNAYNLWLAGDPEFDVAVIPLGDGQTRSALTTMVEQEIIRDIPVEWIDQYYPNMFSAASQYCGLSREDMIARCSMDGKYYAVPAEFYTPNVFVEMIRLDWLEKLGLEMPTDLESYVNVIRAFAKNDPDGNGIDDTYGHNSGHWTGLGVFFAAFGLQRNSYYLQEDGTVINSSTTEAFKEALKLLQSLYLEQAIDPEGLTDDRAKVRDKWANGMIGIIADDPINMQHTVADLLLNKDPNIKLAIMPVLKNGGLYCDWIDPLESQRTTVFSYDCPDEVAIRWLQFLEDMENDVNLFNFINSGVEGVDFKIEDGQWIALSDKPSISGTGIYFSIAHNYGATVDHERRDEFLLAYDIGCDPANWVFKGKNFDYFEENKAKTLYGADVSTIMSEYYGKAVRGTIDIDETWDAYIQSLKDAGLDKIIAEYEEGLRK